MGGALLEEAIGVTLERSGHVHVKCMLQKRVRSCLLAYKIVEKENVSNMSRSEELT